MLHIVSTCLVVAAFFGAGLFNVFGTLATRRTFARWGYPPWWRHLTGGLEMATAILVAMPATRGAGLILGAVIIAAAAVTVLRGRNFSHLAPIGLFLALLAVAQIAS